LDLRVSGHNSFSKMGKNLLVVLLTISIGLVNCYDTISNSREGRVFSLFNIVKFENKACSSTESISTSSTGSSYRNGTCYSSSECSDKGGKSKGSCAAGFGVCCLWLLNTETDLTVTQNNTYIQNPGFPSSLTDAKSLSYTVQKCSDDICFLRMDFEQFDLIGPANSLESDGTSTIPAVGGPGVPNGGECTTDKIEVTSTVTGFVPTICGDNAGQHLYIPMGSSGSSDTATVKITTGGTSTTARTYDILVSQIPCGTDYTPPTGCLQWYTGTSGKIKTFNFDDTVNTHLASQDYQACIRQNAGMCCNQYMVCDESVSGQELSFSIYQTEKKYDAADALALAPSLCTQDYITIAGGATACTTSAYKGQVRDKYCGSKLNVDLTATQHAPICDCSPSFAVGVTTDALTDDQNKVDDAANADRSRGVCLDFKQQPC